MAGQSAHIADFSAARLAPDPCVRDDVALDIDEALGVELLDWHASDQLHDASSWMNSASTGSASAAV